MINESETARELFAGQDELKQFVIENLTDRFFAEGPEGVRKMLEEQNLPNEVVEPMLKFLGSVGVAIFTNYLESLEGRSDREKKALGLGIGVQLGQIDEKDAQAMLYDLGYDVYEGKGMPVPDLEGLLRDLAGNEEFRNTFLKEIGGRIDESGKADEIFAGNNELKQVVI